MRLDEVHAMLAASYWSPSIRKDVVARAMASSVVVGAFDDATGAQVAYARVVTDYATFAWLCDVIVREDHRGRGLSTKMLDALEAVESLHGLRRWCLRHAMPTASTPNVGTCRSRPEHGWSGRRTPARGRTRHERAEVHTSFVLPGTAMMGAGGVTSHPIVVG
jgi:GNAT superfamily N-acetyltransferase